MIRILSGYAKLIRLDFLWYIFLQFLHNSLCVVDPPVVSVLSSIFVPNITFNELNTSVIIEVPNYVLRLDLRPRARDFRNEYFGADGGAISDEGYKNCYFVGTVDNFDKWTAALSVCNGLEGSFGLMEDPDNYYLIEPKSNTTYHELDELHILYVERFEDTVDRNTYYGICDPSLMRESDRFSRPDDVVNFNDDNLPEVAASTQLRIVELLIVNDNKLYTNRRSNLDNVIQRDLVIVDYMNMLFRRFGVEIVLKSVVTWTNQDAITIPRNNDPTVILKAFRDYIRVYDGDTSFDAALLISGRNFLGNVVGLAYKSSMCYGTFSVGIVQDTMSAVTFGGGTASHELGHILGMSHDDSVRTKVCICNDRTGKCIMAGLSLSTPATTWSGCSGEEMFTTFQSNPMTERCLMNVPEMTNFTANLFRGSATHHIWTREATGSLATTISILLYISFI